MQTVSLDDGHATYMQAVACWQWITAPYTETLLWRTATLEEWNFGHRQFFHFSFCSIFISWLIHFLWSFHLLSNENAHFCWWKFGPFTALLGKWITYHKDKWPAMAADALLRNGIVLLDVYWNKSKEREIERLGQ